MADTPDATDTPITAGEPSEDEECEGAADVVAVEAEVGTEVEMLAIAGALVVDPVDESKVLDVLLMSVVLLVGSIDTTDVGVVVEAK